MATIFGSNLNLLLKLLFFSPLIIICNNQPLMIYRKIIVKILWT